ncbi:MAG: hypothetical protein KBC69_01400 [Candidatus Magasanikbacteria bacterium]|nr:hypothetical protein [Candidatus Magasanikbacteria bacterium]
MEPNLLFISVFILGVFSQVFLSINFFEDFRKSLSGLLKAIALSFISLPATIFLFPDQQPGTFFVSALLFWLAILPFFIMFFFRKKVVFSLNETSLLVVNLVAIYFVIQSNLPPGLLALFVIFSCFTIINAFIPVPPRRWQELLFIIWYLILIITTTVINFNYVEVYGNFLGNISTLVPLSFLALGMAFGHAALYASFLYHFSPFRFYNINVKGMSEKEVQVAARKRYEEEKEVSASRYEERSQLSPLNALLLTIIVIGLLLINQHFALVSNGIIIMLTILFATVFDKYKTKTVLSATNI